MTKTALVIKRLEALAKAKEQVKSIQSEYDSVLQSALEMFVPADIQKQLLKLSGKKERKESFVTSVTKFIKETVLDIGESVKGHSLQAVYVTGKRTCDFDKIEGYCLTHPKVKEFLGKTDPTVSIKEVK